MINRSFVDLVFILLCAAVVLLSRSVYMGSVQAAPAEVDQGLSQPLEPTKTRLIVIGATDLRIEGGEPLTDAAAVLDAVGDSDLLALVPADESVSHHRVLTVWSQLRSAGRTVQFAAVPSAAPPPPGQATARTSGAGGLR